MLPLNKTGALTTTEKTVIELKYLSKRFSALSDFELGVNIKNLLLKISAMTGWNIPEGEILKSLVEQLTFKFRESYGDINPDEFLFAFRQFGSTVKEFGKKINISLIDEVIVQYKNYRFELSQMEERVKVTKDVKELPPPEVSDEDFLKSVRILWETAGRNFKKIPVLAYDSVIKISPLTDEQKDSYKKTIVALTGISSGDEFKTYCRQFAVHQYFLNNGTTGNDDAGTIPGDDISAAK